MLQKSVSDYNWKDFWRSEPVPRDDDGHGTAMLSIIHRIAPFAEICCGRIAGIDKDLKDNPGLTSQHLANVCSYLMYEDVFHR